MVSDHAKTIGANIGAIALIAIVLLWGNTYLRQRSLFQEGEKALAANNYIAAIASYEAALHMYTPGSSLITTSAERLWTMGEAFERARNTAAALIAYRSLRSSFYAVRWISQPGKEWIIRCDEKIAMLTRPPGQVQQP